MSDVTITTYEGSVANDVVASTVTVYSSLAVEGVATIVEGDNITVDATDPHHPIVSATLAAAVASVNGHTGAVTLAASDVGAQPVDSDLTAIAALSTTSFGRSLLALADAAAARTAIGAGTSSFDGAYSSLTGKPTLGTAAAQSTTAFDAAGAAAAAQAASQPLDSDLTAIAALSTTTFGRSLLAAADAAAARTLIGAGTSSLALGTSSSTAKAGDYQPTAANISDATTIGRTIITAANAAAVRTALSLATVAATGAYADLSGKPTIPTGLTWFNVKDSAYGAAGDGTTDDTAAINLAIAALNTAGKGVLYFPAGTYKTTAALTTITGPSTVLGDGCADSHFRGAATTITLNSRTAVMFTVGSAAHGTKFSGLNLQNTATLAPTAGAAIQVLGGDGARYEELSVAGFWINMDMQDGQEWTMEQCFIYSPVKYGMKIQHVDLPDGGDMGITNCQFLAGDYDADAAIRWESGGGLRLTNNKINARTLSHLFGVGLDAAITVTTGVMVVQDNSFENIVGPCIRGTLTAFHTMQGAVIGGNEFAYYSSTSASAVDIGGWNAVEVGPNVGIAQGGGSSGPMVKLTTCTNGKVGLNAYDGFASEYTLTTCTNVEAGVVPSSRTVAGHPLSADVTITNTDVGAAATSHTHAASDVTSGTLGTARLGSGTASSSTFLRGDQTWATPSGGGGSVATDAIWDTKGDLAIGTGADTAAKLAVGTNAQVLTADSTQTTGVKWATPSSGFADPLTTKGDLIVHGASTTRLGVGSDGQVLQADAASTNGVKWATPSAGAAASPYFATTSAAGDISMGTASSFTDITGLSLSVAAVAGDKILITTMVTPYTTSGGDMDIGINVAGTVKSINGYANNGTTHPTPISVQWLHTVVSGDISGGNVAIKTQLKSSTGGNWVYNNASHGNFATLGAVNFGH